MTSNELSPQEQHVLKIQRGTHNDLRNAFLAVHASAIVMDIPELATALNIKRQYAAELIGTLENMEDQDGNALVHINLAVGDPGNDGAHDLYSTHFTVDDKSSQEMERIFDAAYPAPTSPEPGSEPVKAAKAPRTPRSATTSNPADLPLCLCGCLQPVTNRKRNYKPGHDARHAGQVARDMANFPGMNNDERRRVLLDALPTDGLRWKAAQMADRLIAKGKAKAFNAATDRADKKDQADTVARQDKQDQGNQERHELGIKPVQFLQGEVKIGRWKYPAEKNAVSGAVAFTRKGKMEVADEKVAKTFDPQTIAGDGSESELS